MAEYRRGRQSFVLPAFPVITAWASTAGKKESEGPLAHTFDITSQDTLFGQRTWEQAEKKLQQLNTEGILKIPGITIPEISIIMELQKQTKANKLFAYLSGGSDEVISKSEEEV